MKLLLVEDSERLQRSLSIGLQKNGFNVDQAFDGQAALDDIGGDTALQHLRQLLYDPDTSVRASVTNIIDEETLAAAHDTRPRKGDARN